MGRVLVRGSVNIDEFFNVPHIANSGETISSTGYSRKSGGKGANQGVAAARAGADIDLAATIGADGDFLLPQLKSFGVNTTHIHTNAALPTGRAIIQLSDSTHDNCIILEKGANYASTVFTYEPKEYSHILLQNEIPLEDTVALLNDVSGPSYSDPVPIIIYNPSPMLTAAQAATFPWKSIHWLIVNEGEAGEVIELLSPGAPYSPDDPLRAFQALSDNPFTGVIVTLGNKGSVALYAGQTFAEPAGRVETLRDTTGAGDCFAGYVAALLARLTTDSSSSSTVSVPSPEQLQAILKVASQAAALCVESYGAMEAVPTMEDVKARLGQCPVCL